MGQAARAIIIENGRLLVMQRLKQGSRYFTLIGGRANEGEPVEQALVREVMEETGLVVTGASLVFYEGHPEPYNQQYVYLCNVAPHEKIGLQLNSEEHLMNRLGYNVHQPLWVAPDAFAHLAFRTPLLQTAIIKGLKKGFPDQPQRLA